MSYSDDSAFLCAPVRTVHGRYGGSLRTTSTVELGTYVTKRLLERFEVPADAVDELIMSHCRQAGNGPNPSRQIVMHAGLGERVPAQTLNMACASGLKAIQLACQSVAAGEAELVLVVAAECMSTMPYIASSRLRWQGVRRGDITLVDGWNDGGLDPVCGLTMGQTAEEISQRFDVPRGAQDDWALESHRRAADAWASGRFADETVSVSHDDGELTQDETIRLDSTPEKLAKLAPAFIDNGTVTAGNSSQMADGAAAILVASPKAVAEYGMEPMGRMRSFAAVGVDPSIMGVGPTAAIPAALERGGLDVDDLDLVEINEAFAAQIVHNVRELKLDPDRVNVNGGGIALGHPTGQSGTRIVVTLLHELARRDGEVGVASLCAGGGQGIAAAIERVG